MLHVEYYPDFTPGGTHMMGAKKGEYQRAAIENASAWYGPFLESGVRPEWTPWNYRETLE